MSPRAPVLGWSGLAAALAVTALLVWFVALAGAGDGSDVEQDGRSHAVTVDGGALLWTADFESAPDCRVRDGASGRALALEAPGSVLRRDAGKIGDLVTTWRVEAPSDRIEVTCGAPGLRGSRQPVLVTDVPAGPAFLHDPLTRIGAAGVLALLVLVAAAVAVAGLSRTSARTTA